MQAHGELQDHHVRITKPKDVGRFYNKSHFGTPQKNNILHLNLLEATFLVAENKLIVHKNKEQISFSKLVELAANNIPAFDLHFQVFSDLRKRGHAIKQSSPTQPSTFIEKQHHDILHIFVYSEYDTIDLFAIKKLIKKINQTDTLWFALVDDEGDITYYSISLIDLYGTLPSQQYPTSNALLIKDRIIITDPKQATQLFTEEFFGKPFETGLQLSLLEALYLTQHNTLSITTPQGKKLTKTQLKKSVQHQQPDILTRYQVYQDLKQRHLVVKTGFKFGTHFRVYTRHPNETHAECLVHLIEKSSTSTWSEISRAVRLAHSVNKEIIFALIEQKSIKYLTFQRVRP